MITATYVRCTLARLTPTDSVCPCCVACCSHAGGDALHLQVLESCYGNRQKHMSAMKRLMYVSYTAIPCLALRIRAGFFITFCTVTPVFGTCPAMSCRWLPPGGPHPAESGAGSWPNACPGSPAEALQTHQTAKKVIHDTQCKMSLRTFNHRNVHILPQHNHFWRYYTDRSTYYYYCVLVINA